MSDTLLEQAKKLVDRLIKVDNDCLEADEIRDQLDEFYYTGPKQLSSKELIELNQYAIECRKNNPRQ